MTELFDPLAVGITVGSVIALVNWAKMLGLPTKRGVPILAMVLGIVLTVVQALVTTDAPVTAELVWTSVMAGVFIGLGASGVHDVAKRASGSTATLDAATETASANRELADSLHSMMTGGVEDTFNFDQVVEFVGPDGVVYAGAANDMVAAGEEIRPIFEPAIDAPAGGAKPRADGLVI